MATYGVKYELKFSDLKGNKRTLEIMKKDYEGEILPVVGTDSPVIISYDNQDDFYNPIVGSSCTINLKTTENISYDEFATFDEREYKVRLLAGQEDDTLTLDSPLWQVANTDWETTDILWAEATVFKVYWEGFLIFDNYREVIISDPYDIQLKALDNLGTLDSYNVPYGNIETDADGDIKTGTGEQTNFDSAFYYLKEILKLTGLDFDIHIQNNIKRKLNNVVINEATSLFHDIQINEFALTNDFVRKDAKVVLKEILRLGNSRLFQADGGWYIISNHNYYDRSVLFAADTSCNQEDDITTKPAVTTDDATNITETSATVNATITNAKGLDIISRGFYIGENAAFAANRAYFSTDTTASFTFDITTLIAGRQYFVTAFASNNLFERSVGCTISFVATTTSSTTAAVGEKPTVDTRRPLANQVFDTKMTLRARINFIGIANVTEFGFYFGTDSFNFENNRKLVAATGQNISTEPYDFTLDTSTVTGPTLTLTAGTNYYITAYAVNSLGTGIGDTEQQQTYNVWNLFNVETNEIKLAVYDSTFSPGASVTVSDSGSTCFTIIQGTTVQSTSGLPTINVLCLTSTDEVTTEEIQSCVQVSLFAASTAKAVCCNDIAVKTAFMNGPDLYSSSTTKLFTDSTCTVLLAAQYVANDGSRYRYFNGTLLETVTGCPSCDQDVDDPEAFIVENEVTGERVNVVYNSVYSVGDRVVISSDSNFCYTIEGEIDLGTSPTVTISSACTTATPTPPEQCPTMTFFAEYQGCGDDNIVIIGNNRNDLPNFVRQKSTSICFFKIGPATTDTQDDNFNLGCFPTNKFDVVDLAGNEFISCDDCNGVTTTLLPSTTSTTTAAPTIFFRIYQALQSDCSSDDFILEVSNETNSFPAVITDGVVCYSSNRDGGSGVDGDVDNYLNFSDCPTCQAYLATTTTPLPTTTAQPCVAIAVYIGTTAVTACCGGRAVTVYANSSSLSTASVVYTDFLCTEIVTPGNYLNQSGTTFFWNGFTLTEITCPACP